MYYEKSYVEWVCILNFSMLSSLVFTVLVYISLHLDIIIIIFFFTELSKPIKFD